MEQFAAQPVPYTVEEYLKMEAQSDIKHEFIDGEIFAMAGGSIAHGEISGNVFAALRVVSKNKNCRPFNSDIQVAISSFRYVYPDTSVVCGPLQVHSANDKAIRNPILIVEVLSETTESYDRGQKFRLYRQIDTFREYVLISQDKPLVEVFYAIDTNHWRYTTYEGLDTIVRLESIDARIPLQEIYLNVELPQNSE